MRVHCPACRRILNIPDDRAANPILKVKCPCGSVFPLQEASLALAAAPPPPQPAAAQAPPPLAAPAVGSPRPTPATRPAVVARPGATSQPATSAAAPAAAGWRRCTNHPQSRSAHVCQACGKGFCASCLQEVRGAFICPACDGLCAPVARMEDEERKERQRARPLLGDIGTIAAYPLVEPVAYVLLAIAVGVFSLTKGFSGYGVVFSEGLLMAYAFSALNRVSQGNLRSFMPAISDVMDMVLPLRLGFVAFLAAAWPLLALAFLGPSFEDVFGFQLAAAPVVAVVHAQPPEEQPAPGAEEPVPDEEAAVEEEPGGGDAGSSAEPDSAGEPDAGFGPEPRPGAGWLLLYALALLWRWIYSPVALTVAVLSSTAGWLSSSLQTMNPVLGAATIWRMGRTYWEALAVYSAIVLAQLALAFPLGFIPIGGTLLRAFVDSYAMLCIGCTLGLAVFKRAKALGMD